MPIRAIVVLIVVAIVVAICYREPIYNWVKKNFKK